MNLIEINIATKGQTEDEEVTYSRAFLNPKLIGAIMEDRSGNGNGLIVTTHNIIGNMNWIVVKETVEELEKAIREVS